MFCLIPLLAIFYSVLHLFHRRAFSPELIFGLAFVLIILGYSLVEYPLWYTYFLFPFAFILDYKPQGCPIHRASKSSSLIRSGLWAVAGAACFLVAADYLRLQNIYTDVGRQREVRKGTADQWLDIPEQISRVAQATFFPLAADYMYARTLAADGFLIDYKRDIARRVMLGKPQGETLARYVCAVLGRRRRGGSRQMADTGRHWQ